MQTKRRTGRDGRRNMPAVVALMGMLAIPMLPAASFAQQQDTNDGEQGPVTSISADEAEIDINTGERNYRGNVKVEHGDIELDADELKMEYGDDGLERILASGDPAKFRKPKDEDGAAASGRSKQIEFDARTRQVVLSGDARLKIGQDRIRGAHISYHLDSGAISISEVKPQPGTGDTGAK